MRFYFGKPPEDVTFSPQSEGWLPICEPEPRGLTLIAFPVSMLNLARLSLLNSLAAAGDITAVWLIFSQINHTAIVRNKGWRTYWKSASDISSNS
jgi:hypothetical protein